MNGLPDHAFGCTCQRHAPRPWNRPEHWTKADVAYLERSYGRRTDDAIAEKLGRSVVGLRLKAKRLGLRKRDVGLSAREVGALLGVFDTTVLSTWIRHGLLRARQGFAIGGGRRRWVVAEADVETFIREHGHWLDAGRVPQDSPFRALAEANRWVAMPDVVLATGHSADWLVWYFRSGLFPTRRKAGRWYMRPEDVAKLPHRDRESIEYTAFVRREMLARRKAKRLRDAS